MPGFATALKKYGPLGVALLALAYLLHHSEQRADRDRAFFFNDLGQQIAELKTACEKGK
jgi:hypothetical protein